jgi:hypothetical protein
MDDGGQATARVIGFPVQRDPENPARPWEPLLSKPVIARHYGVTPWTIDHWCRLGMPYEAGSRRRFRISECAEWHRTYKSRSRGVALAERFAGRSPDALRDDAEFAALGQDDLAALLNECRRRADDQMAKAAVVEAAAGPSGPPR